MDARGTQDFPDAGCAACVDRGTRSAQGQALFAKGKGLRGVQRKIVDTKARVEPALRDADWKTAQSNHSVRSGTWSARDSPVESRSLQALGGGEWVGEIVEATVAFARHSGLENPEGKKLESEWMSV